MLLITEGYPGQSNKKKITVGGQEGVSIDTVEEFGIYETVVFILKDNFIYQIDRTYPRSHKSQYEKNF